MMLLHYNMEKLAVLCSLEGEKGFCILHHEKFETNPWLLNDDVIYLHNITFPDPSYFFLFHLNL